jgi:hypothetical protein
LCLESRVDFQRRRWQQARSERKNRRDKYGYLFYQNRKKLPIIDRAEEIWMWDRDGKRISMDARARLSATSVRQSRVLEQCSVKRQRLFAYQPNSKMSRHAVYRNTGFMFGGASFKDFFVSGDRSCRDCHKTL